MATSEPVFTGPRVLTLTLAIAVPLRISELQQLPRAELAATCVQWARKAAAEIAAHGDVLQYGSKRKGETATAFDQLARGLAAGAFQPGGVTFAGLHFEAAELECSALVARWCPIHGDCTCPDGDVLDNPRCWLHSPNSSHPDGRTTSRAARGDVTWPLVVAATAVGAGR